jgi:hypothetical protein
MLYISWSHLNLIRWLDSSLIAIGVEPECRFITRYLSGRGPRGELDALIAAESEITVLLRRLKLIQQLDSSMLAIGIELEYRSVARSWISSGRDALVVVLLACYETLELYIKYKYLLGTMKDRLRRPEGVNESIFKILQQNLTYVKNQTQRASLITRPKPHNYIEAIGPQNWVRNKIRADAQNNVSKAEMSDTTATKNCGSGKWQSQAGNTIE